MDPLKNWSDSPLVTVQLMTCEADVSLAPRAIASILKQDLDPKDLEIQVVFDGPPSESAQSTLEEALRPAKCPVNLFASPKRTGYYCVPRNMAFPYAWGFYMAHMDADNEWRPRHLSGLLAAIRSPQGDQGWPHFVYSRREYVIDEGASTKLPSGPSVLIPWTPEYITKMATHPKFNFVDTGDFLIGKSTLQEVAERTGSVWNANVRRFGDWDLVKRMAQIGVRGHAVDQITHIYHWHGLNVQLTRRTVETIAVPYDLYQDFRKRGLIKNRNGLVTPND